MCFLDFSFRNTFCVSVGKTLWNHKVFPGETPPGASSVRVFDCRIFALEYARWLREIFFISVSFCSFYLKNNLILVYFYVILRFQWYERFAFSFPLDSFFIRGFCLRRKSSILVRAYLFFFILGLFLMYVCVSLTFWWDESPTHSDSHAVNWFMIGTVY